MTSEQLIRLDQRVINLESVILNLATRVNTLEQALASTNTKLETLNTFYGGSLQTTIDRLLAAVDKASGGEVVR